MTTSQFALLQDQSLVIEHDDATAAVVAPWLPRSAVEQAAPDAHARIVVGTGARQRDAGESDAPVLRLGAVEARFPERSVAYLEGPNGLRATIDLDHARARVLVPGAESADVFAVGAALTLCAAFLLNRMDAALMHAGAAVDADGHAWIIAGDTHAGKSTTCISLVSAGWRYLADDHIVLRRDATGDLFVEGWPRHAHIDEGWSSAETTGRREAVDMNARWPGRWQQSAPLAGIFLPAVHAGAPTAIARVAPVEALAGAIRQSPWLMADAVCARQVLALLSGAAALPAFAVSLGRDSYGKGDVLRRLVESAIAAN